MWAEEYLKIKYSGKEVDKKNPQKSKGAVNVVQNQKEEVTEDNAQVNVVDKKSRKKRDNRQKYRQGRGSGQRCGRGDRDPLKCLCCGESHFLHDCTEWKNIRKKYGQDR